jgi:hypothetical protein
MFRGFLRERHLLETFFAPINIYRVTLELLAGTDVRLHAEWPGGIAFRSDKAEGCRSDGTALYRIL